MKKLFIVANWKSNKTESEAKDWLERFKIYDVGMKHEKEIVVCPPFTLLPILTSYILHHKSNIKLGAQDVSPYPLGAYTGAVAAAQLAELVTHVIIGHSERRKYFHEEGQVLFNKVDMANDAALEPIFCVQDAATEVPKGVKIVAYEPVGAIGTGNPDTPENANAVAEVLKEQSTTAVVLYGGSVTKDNVALFTRMSHIDGVLVGGASLDAEHFSQIVANA